MSNQIKPINGLDILGLHNSKEQYPKTIRVGRVFRIMSGSKFPIGNFIFEDTLLAELSRAPGKIGDIVIELRTNAQVYRWDKESYAWQKCEANNKEEK